MWGAGGWPCPQTTSPRSQALRYAEIMPECLPGASQNLYGHQDLGGFGFCAWLPAERNCFQDRTSNSIKGRVTGLPSGHSQAAEGGPRLSQLTLELEMQGPTFPPCAPEGQQLCLTPLWLLTRPGASQEPEKWELTPTQRALALGTWALGLQVVVWRGQGWAVGPHLPVSRPAAELPKAVSSRLHNWLRMEGAASGCGECLRVDG